MNANEKLSGTKIYRTESLPIGGIPQWISLRSGNSNNPIMLFLHGGPGTAQISFSRKSQRGLEDYFLVVNWDQRGSGRSYSRSLRKEDMEVERFVADAEELIELLLKRCISKKFIWRGTHGEALSRLPSGEKARFSQSLFWDQTGCGDGSSSYLCRIQV